MNNDLIESLSKMRDAAIGYDREILERAITALSPALPEDVANMVQHLHREAQQAEDEYGHPAQELLQWEAADLIERLAREVNEEKNLVVVWRKAAEKREQRIEELEGSYKVTNDQWEKLCDEKDIQIAEYEKAMEKMANFDGPKWVENFARTKLERIRRMK